MGSTASSTALLQYEIDVPLTELARKHGIDNAGLAYRACAQALEQLDAVCTEVGDCGYARARTRNVASKPRHVGRLQEEAKAALALPLNGWMADGSGRCSASARREGS